MTSFSFEPGRKITPDASRVRDLLAVGTWDDQGREHFMKYREPPPDELEGVPGTCAVRIDSVRTDDPRMDQLLPGLRTIRYRDAGYNLEDLKEELGDLDGFLTAPSGRRLRVSIRAFLGPEFRGARFYPEFLFRRHES